MKVCNKSNDDDLVSEMLHIDELHHRFQKIKGNLTQSDPDRNMNLSTSNTNDKDKWKLK